MRTLDTIEKGWRKKILPKFDVGDTVDVHVRITEGEKERIQIFTGIVIARRHQGLSETFTVRRIVQAEGVERVFPIHSPRVAKVLVKRRGKVRRAKLNYLRQRVGRRTKVEEKTGTVKPVKEAKPPEEKPEPKSGEVPAQKPKSEKVPAKKPKSGEAPAQKPKPKEAPAKKS